MCVCVSHIYIYIYRITRCISEMEILDEFQVNSCLSRAYGKPGAICKRFVQTRRFIRRIFVFRRRSISFPSGRIFADNLPLLPIFLYTHRRGRRNENLCKLAVLWARTMENRDVDSAQHFIKNGFSAASAISLFSRRSQRYTE